MGNVEDGDEGIGMSSIHVVHETKAEPGIANSNATTASSSDHLSWKSILNAPEGTLNSIQETTAPIIEATEYAVGVVGAKTARTVDEFEHFVDFADYTEHLLLISFLIILFVAGSDTLNWPWWILLLYTARVFVPAGRAGYNDLRRREFWQPLVALRPAISERYRGFWQAIVALGPAFADFWQGLPMYPEHPLLILRILFSLGSDALDWLWWIVFIYAARDLWNVGRAAYDALRNEEFWRPVVALGRAIAERCRNVWQLVVAFGAETGRFCEAFVEEVNIEKEIEESSAKGAQRDTKLGTKAVIKKGVEATAEKDKEVHAEDVTLWAFLLVFLLVTAAGSIQ